MISALALSALLAAVPVRATHAPPGTGSNEFEQEGVVRLFKANGPFRLMGEARARWEALPPRGAKLQAKFLTLGSYFRPHRNLKLGAFYRLQAGVIHDDDWIVRGADPTAPWEWEDVRSRVEHVLVGEISPRVQASVLPGRNWILELKTRFLANSFNGDKTVKLRPGVTYHWVRRGAPFLSFYLQYEMYFPLNYSDETIYETWVYPGVIAHLSKRWNLGVYVAFREVNWTTSEAWHTHFKTYERTYESTMLGLSINYNLPD